MIKNTFLSVTLLLFVVSLPAQNKVSGFVRDAETGELLIGATVIEPNTNNGVATNTNGYFSILTDANSIEVSYIGYSKEVVNIENGAIINVELKPGTDLAEIQVSGQRFRQFNTATLSKKELLSIPAIGGKPDVMKTLQLMPGIQSQSEGTSLINVRGGNPGENLYLIDNVPLIYVNHLGGFLSVFNPDMINSMDVYKGGFPAKYGGKLSSIMSITQREGDKTDWKGNLGLGVSDASFCVEGPIYKDKASLMLTGRKTLIDPLMILASGLSQGGDYFLFYGFHDINGKLTYRPNTKNSYHLNFYQGDDYLKYWSKREKTTGERGRVNNVWGNWMLSGRWSRIVTPRLFVNNIVSLTNYRLKVAREFSSNAQGDSINFKGEYLSTVRDVSLRSDWQFKVAENYDIEFGAKLTQLGYVPNYIYNSNSDQNTGIVRELSYENSLYLSNQFSLLCFLDADLGLRFVSFMNNNYSKSVWEPRLMVNARINNWHALNFTYQKVNQFAHLLYSSGAIMNNEIWVPSSESILPSQSKQYSLGWKGNFINGCIEAEVNLYHKESTDLATYKEGYSNLLGDGGWKSKIEVGGMGQSNGAEFMVRKISGNWTGFVGYTYSKTTRQFPGINRGNEYVFDYDRPHSFAISLNRKLSEKWNASATWVYQTGLPYTPVIGRQITLYGIDKYREVLIYGERNSGRMKDYHRLDLGFTQERITKRGRRALLTLSVYNAYCRLNPNAYMYSTEKTYDDIENGVFKPFKLYQMSFFPIIPSISYKVFFGK